MRKMILGRIRKQQVQIQRFFKDDIKKWENKEVEITQAEQSKTQEQLGYLFGVVLKLVSEHTGFTVEESYQVYKNKYLRYHKSYRGKIYRFTKGLSQCKISETAKFIEEVIQHAQTELKIIIPEPDVKYDN